MRLLLTSPAPLAATGVALPAAVTAHADPGCLCFIHVGATQIWTAPAARPVLSRWFPRPMLVATPRSTLSRSYRPDGSSAPPFPTHVRRNSGRTTTSPGCGASTRWRRPGFVNDPDMEPNHTIDGLSWGGEHRRLYFSLSHGILASNGNGHGDGDRHRPRPGPRQRRPGAGGAHHGGLFGLTVDPTGDRLAAVVSNPGVCAGTGSGERPNIVVLNLRTHQRRRPATSTSRRVSVPGTGRPPLVAGRDAHRVRRTRLHASRPEQESPWMRAVETVATGVHASHRPRVVSPCQGSSPPPPRCGSQITACGSRPGTISTRSASTTERSPHPTD